ncbi:hypothetical protein BGX34_005011 [Mortierella sp. NVP85]|nr:hypothetical protein BGX34_005011 [Mortierella sp. NVP85]
MLESLSIQDPPLDDQFDKVYWNLCKVLVRQNSTHLRSLTLLDWKLRRKPQPGQPIWHPILSCTRHPNLRSLTIRRGMIRQRHMAAFWELCRQLEYLNMDSVCIDVPRQENFGRGKRGTSHSSTWTTLLVQFPKLHSFDGRYTRRRYAQDVSSATILWERLGPISTSSPSKFATTTVSLNSLSGDEYETILRAPFKFLDKFDLLRRYFETLVLVDLTYAIHPLHITGPWVQEVLESCPSLEKIRAEAIAADHIFTGKSWVCLRLKDFRVMIYLRYDMNDGRGPKRPTFKQMEKMWHDVFGRLGQLRQLWRLDMQP